MSDNIQNTGELERKIKDKETLLIEAESRRITGWMPLLISLGIVIAMAIKIPRSGVYIVITGFGLLYFGINVWRLYSAENRRKEIESELKEYRDIKAELLESSIVKE